MKICRECKILLNESNRVKNGALLCKKCKYIQERKTLLKKRTTPICSQCNKETIKKGTPPLICSEKCYFEYNTSIQNDGCHLWRLSNKNNPVYRFNGSKSIQIRRLIFNRTHGEIPENNAVISICNNYTCINIDHLRLAPFKEISATRSLKTRKLTQEQIVEIKDLKHKYNWSNIQIGKKYNISDVLVKKITTNKIYKNIKNEIEQLIQNQSICSNCEKQHDNTESEFCSPLCMQEFLLK